MSNEFSLIDLSGIAHSIWHIASAEPDPNYTSNAVVAKVRSLAGNMQSKVAICLDRGKSFRKGIDAQYKANRPEHDGALMHQIQLAIETLKKDGFPLWGQDGYEADDIIASATHQLLARNDTDTVRIFTVDKDLLQLVGPRVVAQSTRDGRVLDAKAVEEKYGVPPHLIRDFLALVGDTSDNVKGAKGIGPKKAPELLKQYGSIDLMLGALQMSPTSFSQGLTATLKEFQPRATQVQALITLRNDAPIPLAEIDKPRVPDDVAAFGEGDDTFNVDELEGDDIDFAMPTAPAAAEVASQAQSAGIVAPADVAGRAPAPVTPPAPPATTPPPSQPASPPVESQLPQPVLDQPVAPLAPKAALPTLEAPKTEPGQKEREAPAVELGLARREPVALAQVVSGPFEMQLEPQNLESAKTLAQWMFQSRLFSAYGTPQGVLATIMAGREFGLQAHAALRGFHIIEGRQAMAADLIRALVIKRKDICKFFRCKERSATAATFVTQREGDPEPIELRYTIEEAQAAGVVKPGSGWAKNPADMLVARASSKLARLVYPDVMFGMYAPEEFD